MSHVGVERSKLGHSPKKLRMGELGTDLSILPKPCKTDRYIYIMKQHKIQIQIHKKLLTTEVSLYLTNMMYGTDMFTSPRNIKVDN